MLNSVTLIYVNGVRQTTYDVPLETYISDLLVRFNLKHSNFFFLQFDDPLDKNSRLSKYFYKGTNVVLYQDLITTKKLPVRLKEHSGHIFRGYIDYNHSTTKDWLSYAVWVLKKKLNLDYEDQRTNIIFSGKSIKRFKKVSDFFKKLNIKPSESGETYFYVVYNKPTYKKKRFIRIYIKFGSTIVHITPNIEDTISKAKKIFADVFGKRFDIDFENFQIDLWFENKRLNNKVKLKNYEGKTLELYYM